MSNQIRFGVAFVGIVFVFWMSALVYALSPSQSISYPTAYDAVPESAFRFDILIILIVLLVVVLVAIFFVFRQRTLAIKAQASLERQRDKQRRLLQPPTGIR